MDGCLFYLTYSEMTFTHWIRSSCTSITQPVPRLQLSTILLVKFQCVIRELSDMLTDIAHVLKLPDILR